MSTVRTSGGEPGPRPSPRAEHSTSACPEPRPIGSREDPYFQAELRLSFAGVALAFASPHSAFSSARIDEGSSLLLESLAAESPGRFLDLGCGYGALGLALAARYPEARGVLVDRDLLAVEYCRWNAARLGLEGVEVFPSLGYSALDPVGERFDRILSNVPARAGERVLEHFVAGGVSRLAPGGRMDIVAIRPLAPVVEGIAARLGLVLEWRAESTRHVVASFPAPSSSVPDRGDVLATYERDRIRLELPEPLSLARPTDLADEPHRLADAIPLLARALPESAPRRALVFRAGYGLVSSLLLARYPAGSVLATDRDLLVGLFASHNAGGHAGRLRVVDGVDLECALPEGPFDLVVGELCPPAGVEVARRELALARRALAPGGTGLVLGVKKSWRDLEESGGRPSGLRLRGSSGLAVLLELGGGPGKGGGRA